MWSTFLNISQVVPYDVTNPLCTQPPCYLRCVVPSKAMSQPCDLDLSYVLDSTGSLVGCDVVMIVLNPSHPDEVILIVQ